MKEDLELKNYTAWVESELTQQQKQRAYAFARSTEVGEPDLTAELAARSHWMRVGQELLIKYLFESPTLNTPRPEADPDMDFGAEQAYKREQQYLQNGRK